MSTVYLLKYNNYYNRQVRRPLTNNDIPTYEDFINSGAVWLATYENINFKLGNRINQEIILNYDIQAHDEPDYCIVVEDDGSRTLWFILEIERTRKGQAKFALYRDLMNTYYNKIRGMKAFIEKGFVPSDNNLIFNSENMTYNQIKSGEILLRDEAKGPWIVGYVAKNAAEKLNCSFGITKAKGVIDDSSKTHTEYLNSIKKVIDRNTIHYFISAYNSDTKVRWYECLSDCGTDTSKRWASNITQTSNPNGMPVVNDFWTGKASLNKIGDVIDGKNWTSYYNFERLYSDLVSFSDGMYLSKEQDLLARDGKVVQFSDGYYKISITSTQIGSVSEQYVSNSGALQTGLESDFKQWLDYIDVYNSGKPKVNPTVKVSYKYHYYTVEAEEVNAPVGTKYTYDLKTDLKPLDDAGYKMFVIPYFGNGFDFIDGVWTNPDLNFQWAMHIATELGSNLYDLQILPYCPLSISVTDNNAVIRIIRDADDVLNTNYFYLKEGEYVKGVAYMADVSTFTRTINHSIEIENYKIESECNSYRICSPNYASVFEFNAAKNDGVDYFEAECTYKPFNPYICVHPRFKRLYGADFFDNRGLICSGDFSLPIVTDAWVQYEIQNKNYNQIFNRQIENLSVNNSIARQEALAGAISGVVQGGAQGAMTGAMATGSPWGAAAGAVVGTTGAAIGGALDYNNLLKRQQETIDYTRDQFGYQLGNIKALPNTLSNVGSLVANSKFIPFLEFYTCTAIEKEALKEKIKYNGMTVGIIGYIDNYLSNLEETYIKAKPIRFDEDSWLWDIDYHEAVVLAEELNKGVYM